jgi:hypothetical protein
MTEREQSQSRAPRASNADYTRLLDAFGAEARTPADCVRHLESLGFATGSARNAVYRYRARHGLLKSRRGSGAVEQG